MKIAKIGRQVLKMIDGAPVCLDVIVGVDETEMLQQATKKWGKIHLFPCPPDATVEQCNMKHENKKMRGYGGFGI